jgi:hypothetical protein
MLTVCPAKQRESGTLPTDMIIRYYRSNDYYCRLHVVARETLSGSMCKNWHAELATIRVTGAV